MFVRLSSWSEDPSLWSPTGEDGDGLAVWPVEDPPSDVFLQASVVSMAVPCRSQIIGSAGHHCCAVTLPTGRLAMKTEASGTAGAEVRPLSEQGPRTDSSMVIAEGWEWVRGGRKCKGG